MKKFCIKSLSCAAAVAVCLSMTACADEKNTHSDLDMLIADLSTSYLDDDEPEETEQTDDDTDTRKDADDPKYTYLEDFSDINSMYYDANMLQMALQAMADYMAGNVVEQEQLQSVQWYFQPEVEASGEDTPEETE